MIAFPLLLIPLAICHIIAFLMPGVQLNAALMAAPLMSGGSWTFTLSDVLLALGILLLMAEVIKAGRDGKYFTDHALALLVFGGAAAEFALLPQFANSTFFLLALLTLVDFFTGVALRPRRPRRVAAAAVPEAAPVPPPARIEPAPAPMPAAPAYAPAPAAPVVVTPRPVEPAMVEPIVQTAPVEPAPVPHEPAPDHERPDDTKPPANLTEIRRLDV